MVSPARNAYDRLGYLLAGGDSRREVSSAVAEARAALDVVIRAGSAMTTHRTQTHNGTTKGNT